MRKMSRLGLRASLLAASAVGMTSVLAATPTQKSMTSLRTSPTPNNYITADANYYTADSSNQEYVQASGGGGGRSKTRSKRSSKQQSTDTSADYAVADVQSNPNAGWFGWHKPQTNYPAQQSTNHSRQSSQVYQQDSYAPQQSSGSQGGGIRGFFSNLFHPNQGSQATQQSAGLTQSRYNGYTQQGRASWYGSDAHGGPTASGERFNMNEMTAAHKSLPLNTVVQVTNLRNGSQCMVRINDRGPYVGGRILDLSKAAAYQLGMVGSGTANVQLTVLGRAAN